MIKTREELIKKYIGFFKSKNHKELPSTSLVPENDPTVLFTTAGMHPLVPFLTGQKHPLGKRLVSVQKCLRTQDIEEVGDEVHHTFFEMLGNWSLGDAEVQNTSDTSKSRELSGYWKKEAIEYSFEFLTSKNYLGIPKEKLAVSCFRGDKDAEKDEESSKIWKSLGISDKRIAFLPKENNWWGPAGELGPCGPDTEMFYWIGKNEAPKKFNPEDKNWVEIWNDVFMQYEKKKRTILVDGMHCLYDKNFKINEELFEILQSFNARKILVVNCYKEKAEELVGKYGYSVFSFEGRINKDNEEFFGKLLEKYSLTADEVTYFDHDKTNIKTANKVGISKTILYEGDIKKVENFVKENLYFFVSLKQKNVDTGMGVERTLAVLNGLNDNYLTMIFLPTIKEIEEISGKKYEKNKKETRIIADHLRASVFILGDERAIKPSNVEQGYVLRRLIRRAIRYGKLLGIKEKFTKKIAETAILQYKNSYRELEKNKHFIFSQLDEEEGRFDLTLEKGLRVFEKIVLESGKKISGENAFLLFQSYGFPIEMTVELAREKKKEVDTKSFEQEYKKHQELSRTASAGVFKSGLADNSEQTTKLHTATHLLNEALRRVLGKEVRQKGSNINPERLRFDFNFSRKLTDEEIKKVEELVNKKISEGLGVIREEMPFQEALNSGAQAEFGARYPDIVSVYIILDKNEKTGWFSKEICTGPHVKNTSQIGKFKIIKEEGVAAGVRRIKAVVE